VLKDLRVLIDDEGRYYRFAKADVMDQGHGLIVWLEPNQIKTSRHSDGRTLSGEAGRGQAREQSLRVPFSDIRHELVCCIPIPSDATITGKPFSGTTGKAFVFPSSALRSNSSFAAELADAEDLPHVLRAWEAHPGVVSAQTWVSSGAGKALVLTIVSESAASRVSASKGTA
jgi:hypothetical protein